MPVLRPFSLSALRLSGLLLMGMLVGCMGSIESGPSGPVGRDLCLNRPREVDVPMRRLMPVEYQAALVDMFGPGVPDTSSTYPVPLSGYGFRTYADAHRVGEMQAEALLITAEDVAVALAPSFPDCAGQAIADCARATLTPWIGRAFRRTPDAADIDRLVGVATGAAADGLAPNEAIAVAVIALLQEPRFLYLVESRAATPAWSLDGDERAQRLALTFWQGLPDDALSADSARGALSSPEGMSAATARIVADPRARATFRRFAREWLGLATLPTTHAPEVRAALDAELDLLLDEAWEADDGLEVMLRADTAYADTVLEAFYGLPSLSSGPGDFRRVSMPGDRIGLLTHPLVLAAASHGMDSSPILRGKLIRTRVMCGVLGTPPVNAASREPVLPATATARERYEARIQNTVCASCHIQMDPVGFGLERWDGLGRVRTELLGRPIDELAEISLGGDATGVYEGPDAMLTALATSDEVTECFARQWTRYALGRDEAADAMCVALELSGAFRESGRSIPALFTALGESPAFVSRTAEVP